MGGAHARHSVVRYVRSGVSQPLRTNMITMIDSKIAVQISSFINGVLIFLS